MTDETQEQWDREQLLKGELNSYDMDRISAAVYQSIPALEDYPAEAEDAKKCEADSVTASIIGPVVNEILKERLPKVVTPDNRPPSEGHLFRIAMDARGSHGDAEGNYADSDWWGGYRAVEVRAWSLRQAMEIAIAMPLSAWFETEEDDDPDRTDQ